MAKKWKKVKAEFVCEQCGKRFTDDRRRVKFCPGCAKARQRERSRESIKDGKRYHGGIGEFDAWADYSPENRAETLRKANTKPKWCSDVRWRIELRRRRGGGWYENFGCKP